jgi:hypothetical protein
MDLHPMWLPRPRFTVRLLVIAVAVVGIAAAIEMGRRRRAEFLATSERHRKAETASLSLVELIDSLAEKTDKSEYDDDPNVKAYREARDRRRTAYLALAK